MLTLNEIMLFLNVSIPSLFKKHYMQTYGKFFKVLY